MVIYNLMCLCGFQTEGWFADEAAYAAQKQAEQVVCPVCQSISMRAKLRENAEEGEAEALDQTSATPSLQHLAQQLMQWADGLSPVRRETLATCTNMIPFEGAVENIDMNDAALGETDESEEGSGEGLDLSMEDVTWEETGSAFSVALAETHDEKPIDINWQVFKTHPQQSWRRGRSTRPKVEKKSAERDAKAQALEKNVMEIARTLVAKALTSMLAKTSERHAPEHDGNSPKDAGSATLNPNQLVSREELDALREEGIESLTIAITDKRRWN